MEEFLLVDVIFLNPIVSVNLLTSGVDRNVLSTYYRTNQRIYQLINERGDVGTLPTIRNNYTWKFNVKKRELRITSW